MIMLDLKNNFNKYLTSLPTPLFYLLAIIGGGILLLFPTAASANVVTDTLGLIVGIIANLFIELLGILFTWLVTILVSVAQFNHFIDLEMVQTGWSLARDVANMFFIVVLLIIAFSTILKIQSYHYQRTLVKLIVMAVLINFSKLICGFLIDFFQVIMLTFVNGFKDVAAGNFADSFQIYRMLSLAQGDQGSFGSQDTTAIAAVLAVIMLLVADMVLLIMIAVLLYRIAMLWVLVILSPLAYLAYAISPKYWSMWWQMFFQHLTSGPVIAFFLWLALLTAQKGELEEKLKIESQNAANRGETVEDTYLGININSTALLNYMAMIALLLGGLAIAQKMAQQSGSVVGSFAQKVQKYGTRTAMLGTGAAALGWLVKSGAPGAYQYGARKLAKATGGRSDILFRPIRTFQKVKEGFRGKRELEELEIETEAGKVLEKGGPQALIFGATSKDFAYNLHGFLGLKGMKDIVGHKARTARQIAQEIYEDREEQQERMEKINRPNRDEYYIDNLEKEAQEVTTERETAVSQLEEHRSQVTQKIEQSDALRQEAFKIKNSLEKDIEAGVISEDSKEAQVRKEKISQLEEKAERLKQEAEEIESKPEYRARLKRLAVQAYGYDGAIERGYVKEEERGQIKDKYGNLIKEGQTFFDRENSTKEQLDEARDLKERAEGGDNEAFKKLDEMSIKFIESELENKKRELEYLQAGGLSDVQKESKRAEFDKLGEQLTKAERELKIEQAKPEAEQDKVRIAGLEELIDNIKKEREKLNALLSARTFEDIEEAKTKGVVSEDDLSVNKEENKGLIEKISKEINSLYDIQQNPYISEVEREKLRKEYEEEEKKIYLKEEKLREYSSYIPQAYYSRQAGRLAMNEEMKKIDTSNEDELKALFKNALRTNNISKALAVTMAAARVGHLNEVVQDQKASKDIYLDLPDGTKRLIAKKGQYFSSGVEGLHAFVKDIFIDKLKMSEQNAYSFENDFSDMAQSIGHWTFAQAMGVKNGQFYQRDRDEQQLAVSIEKSKQDFENLMRRTNRLGWMTEKWVDDYDPTSGRTAILNAEAIDAIRSNFKAIEGLIGKQRFNVNLAMNLTTEYNMKILREIAKTLPAKERAEFKEFIESLLDYVNKTKDQAMTTKSVGNVQSDKIKEAQALRERAGISF